MVAIGRRMKNTEQKKKHKILRRTCAHHQQSHKHLLQLTGYFWCVHYGSVVPVKLKLNKYCERYCLDGHLRSVVVGYMWRLSRYSLRSENICLWHFWTCRNWSLATALASVSRLLCVFARFAHDTAVIISALTANCVYVCARVAFSLARTLLLVCDEQSGRTTTTIDDRRSCEDRTRLSTIRLPIAPLWFSIDILARVFLSPLLFWFYCQSVACARTLCLCVCGFTTVAAVNRWVHNPRSRQFLATNKLSVN